MPDPFTASLSCAVRLAALAIPTIQASRAPIHDHQRLRAALVAHRGAGREAGAVAGDFDVFVAGAGRGGRLAPLPALPRRGGGRSNGDGRGFFWARLVLAALLGGEGLLVGGL